MIGYGLWLRLHVLGFFLALLWTVLSDCLLAGAIIATMFWLAKFFSLFFVPPYVLQHVHTRSDRLISNKLWRLKSSGPVKPVEWAYCFDVHLNAFFPLALYIYAIQMLCWPRKNIDFILIFAAEVIASVPSHSASYSQYSQYHGLQLHLASGCHLLHLCHISRLYRYTHLPFYHVVNSLFFHASLLLAPPPRGSCSIARHAQHYVPSLLCPSSDASLHCLYPSQVECCPRLPSLLPLEGSCCSLAYFYTALYSIIAVYTCLFQNSIISCN